jgi:hypothetical protein
LVRLPMNLVERSMVQLRLSARSRASDG